MQISVNTALFSILGTTHGGNGTTTFALPNLQGQVPAHVGPGFALGQAYSCSQNICSHRRSTTRIRELAHTAPQTASGKLS